MTTRLFLSLAAALAACVLAACSASYQKLSITGGYTDRPIDKDTAVVAVGGNGWTSRAKVEAMVMLRAAELTLERGYSRFSLLKPDDKTKAVLQAGQEAQLGPYLHARAERERSGPAIERSTATIYNPSFGALPSIEKHSGGGYVVMSKSGGVYDAREIVARLRPKLMPKEDEQKAAEESEARS